MPRLMDALLNAHSAGPGWVEGPWARKSRTNVIYQIASHQQLKTTYCVELVGNLGWTILNFIRKDTTVSVDSKN